jgi:hypothetical protein
MHFDHFFSLAFFAPAGKLCPLRLYAKDATRVLAQVQTVTHRAQKDS